MTLTEKRMDLFTVGKEYHLAHCIASDLGMSAGIAVQMQKRFHIRGKIEKSPNLTVHPTCILTGRVFNLITKARSSAKPTMLAMTLALIKMHSVARDHGIQKIAMPRIGCGLDRLPWCEVRFAIKDTFEKTDIDILVCKWK